MSSSCSPLPVCLGRVTNLRRATYVVLDEADRMFDMGFEPQVGACGIFFTHCFCEVLQLSLLLAKLFKWSFLEARMASIVKVLWFRPPGDAYCGQRATGPSDCHVFSHLPQSHGGAGSTDPGEAPRGPGGRSQCRLLRRGTARGKLSTCHICLFVSLMGFVLFCVKPILQH